MIEALLLARDAAVRLGDADAETEVDLALGRYFGRLGSYAEENAAEGEKQAGEGLAFAYDRLARAARRANLREDTGPALRQEAEAYRRLGEVHLHHGAFRDAAVELGRAAQLADQVGDKSLIRLIDLTRSVALHRLPVVLTVNTDDDELMFWETWIDAERSCRRYQWKSASKALHVLRALFADDALRSAVLLLRLAELRIDQLRLDPDVEPERSRVRAVHRSAEALYRFQRIYDYAGATRARCVLVRALLATGRAVEAREQLDFARQDAARVDPMLGHQLSPLQAALQWAAGEYLLHLGDAAGARRTLLAAAVLFRLHGDRNSEAGVLHAAGLDAVPDDAFAAGPPGRRTDIWIEAFGPELRLDQPFAVHYTVAAPAVTADLPPAGARHLDIVLRVEGGDVLPLVHSVRLDPLVALPELRFEVRPELSGVTRMQVLVYDAAYGVLLRRTDVRPPRTARLSHPVTI
ncbi:hypothetical protein ACFO1B_18525 [Dactylosporangium siamense]|uniref:Tetratricopeptide repeat protein n=1 Tax=Dactylosporangium siamense TaxID=685454 RepID=A0A919U9Y9_9ACTN|nr:hypothetical protein [Dactylosporangium siamense]GIG43871.1 hypothetical protein Dsi01nite_019120 [Dactylosporangium siamense]